MAENETAAAPAAETGEAPSTQATETDAKIQAFAHAMDAAGLRARVPSGMKYHGGKTEEQAAASATGEKPTDGERALYGDKATPKPSEKKPEPQKRPNPYEPPADLTQRKLADSYAAYVRKSTKLAKQEADFAQRVQAHQSAEARVKELEAAITKRDEDLKAKFGELDFLEKDPAEWLDRYAKRRGMSTAALYDRLLGAKLNDGKLAPDQVADDVKRELARTQAEIDALKKKDADEKAEVARLAKERDEQQQIARAIHGEKVAFISYLRDEAEGAHPLLLEEAKADPEAAATKAYELAVAYHRAGKTLTAKEVAAEMERQLAYAKWREDEEAKAKGAPAKPPPAAAKPQPSEETSNGKEAPSAKPEIPKVVENRNRLRPASGPKTITNKMTARHSAAQGLTVPRNDNERLKNAVAQWGKS